MNDMLFSVNIISMKNASIIQGPIIVNGDELENYIHNIRKKNNKYLFDEIQTFQVYDEQYIKRTEIGYQNTMNMTQNVCIHTSRESILSVGMEPPEEV